MISNSSFLPKKNKNNNWRNVRTITFNGNYIVKMLNALDVKSVHGDNTIKIMILKST